MFFGINQLSVSIQSMFFFKSVLPNYVGHTYIEVWQDKEGLNKTNIIYHWDHLIYVIVLC